MKWAIAVDFNRGNELFPVKVNDTSRVGEFLGAQHLRVVHVLNERSQALLRAMEEIAGGNYESCEYILKEACTGTLKAVSRIEEWANQATKV